MSDPHHALHLQALVDALRNRHYGRMPEEVQQAYDAAIAALAQPAQAPAQPAPPVVALAGLRRLHERMLEKVQPALDGGAVASSMMVCADDIGAAGAAVEALAQRGGAR